MLFPCLGIEPKLNILEIVKPVETVEVVIDPDAHHAEAEAHLVEEAQVITLDGTKHIATISDETSEQVTRWAAALEGYRKEQERLGIPYGNGAQLWGCPAWGWALCSVWAWCSRRSEKETCFGLVQCK